ncbi:MAG: phage tail tape measure protein [Syntrophaceae bacterium]|nr:phage tail tape measure protein [Syntrophaceae bacterium]
MADVQKTIEILFGGKDNVSPVVADIGKSFSTLDASVGKVTDPLAKVADSVLKIDAALVAMAVGGMALAIKESSTFNKSFALISTSITATGADLAKYREDILTYSTGSVKSLEDINSALYTAAQAGVKWTDSLEFIGKAEQLAVANNANLNTTVDLLTSTMNAYGFTLKDVGHLNDVFFQSTLIGKQTIDSLGQSMGLVVAIAANSGVSFEQLSAAIATMTAKGMETSEAITAVKGVITSIISPSQEVAEKAKALGLNFSLTSLSAKGFSNMLHEIMMRTGGSKEKIVGLFEEVRAMNGVLQLTGDSMKFFDDALKQIEGSSGAAEKAYRKMVETFENQAQKVKNTLKAVLTVIGSQLEEDAGKIAGAFGNLLKGIKIGVESGAFDPLFEYLDDVAASISTWLNAVAAAFPDALKRINYSGLIAALKDLGKALGGMFGDLDLTKANDLAGALQVIVDIIIGFIRVTTGMVDAFKPFASQIAAFFKEMASGDDATQRAAGNILLFSKAIKEAGLGVVAAILAIDELRVSMAALFDIVAGSVQLLWGTFMSLVTGVESAVLAAMASIATMFDRLTFGLIPGLKSGIDDINRRLEVVLSDFAKNSGNMSAGVARLASGIAKLGEESSSTSSKIKALGAELGKVPTRVTTTYEMQVAKNNEDKMKELRAMIAALPTEKQVTIKTLADGAAIEKAHGMLIEKFPDGSARIVNIKTVADQDSLDKAKKAIDDAAKTKEVELKAKLDEAKLKEQSAIIQSAIEWKAKVDISQIEAATTTIKTMFASIDNTITNSGTLTGTMISAYASASSGSSLIYEQIQKESQRRDEALKTQKSLIDAQVDLLKEQARMMKKGEYVPIKISADGVEPHITAFMFEILKKIQVQANMEGQKFLLGL